MSKDNTSLADQDKDNFVLVRVPAPRSQTLSPVIKTESKSDSSESKTALVKPASSSNSPSSVLRSPANVGMRSSFLSPNKIYKFRLTVVVGSTSSAAGLVNDALSLNPSGYDDWSTISTMFDEFRVVAGKLHYVPNNRYSKVSTITSPAVMFFDNDSSTPGLTTIAQCYQYRVSSCGSLDDPQTLSWKRPGITPSAYWTDVGSPANSVGSVSMFSAGNTASTTYGLYFAEIMVEARSRR
jgi:hypothetical protein